MLCNIIIGIDVGFATRRIQPKNSDLLINLPLFLIFFLKRRLALAQGPPCLAQEDRVMGLLCIIHTVKPIARSIF